MAAGNARASCERELDILSQLSHPSIVKVNGVVFGTVGPHPVTFIELPLYSGGNLQEWLTASPREVWQKHEVMRQV